MNSQAEQLILDNPNVYNNKLAELIGVSRSAVCEHKKKHGITPRWYHSGCGAPFLCFDKHAGAFRVRFRRCVVFSGMFHKAHENIDRLIYCIENNDGKLPPKSRRCA